MKDDLIVLAMYLGGDRPLSQVALSKWFGVTQPTLSAWYTGRYKPGEAARTVVRFALRLGESRSDLLTHDDPGADGFERLVNAVGLPRAVRMTGGHVADTGPVKRLAWLVEIVKQHAPELLDTPSSAPKPAALPMPWAAPAQPVLVPVKPKPPETWTSEDGITVWIPEHIRYSPDLIKIHTTGKSAYLRSQGLTTDVPDNQNLT